MRTILNYVLQVLEKAGMTNGIRSVCVYGGVPKWGQKQKLRWGVDVVVATPGRLKDLVQMGCLQFVFSITEAGRPGELAVEL